MNWLKYIPPIGEAISRTVKAIRGRAPVKRPPLPLRIWAIRDKARQEALEKFFDDEPDDAA